MTSVIKEYVEKAKAGGYLIDVQPHFLGAHSVIGVIEQVFTGFMDESNGLFFEVIHRECRDHYSQKMEESLGAICGLFGLRNFKHLMKLIEDEVEKVSGSAASSGQGFVHNIPRYQEAIGQWRLDTVDSVAQLIHQILMGNGMDSDQAARIGREGFSPQAGSIRYQQAQQSLHRRLFEWFKSH